MLGNIKTGKRRVYQNVMQKVFKAEETTSDEEFEKAVKWFKSYEKELCIILKEARNYVKSSSSFAVTTSLLCSAFNQSLSTATEYATDDQVLSVKQLSDTIETKNQGLENVTLPALSQFLFDSVQNKLSNLLSTVFPIIKKQIASHNGLRKDLESYRRRVRKLQRQGKDVGDKELDKLTVKLKTTQSDYTEAHTILVNEIRKLSHEKPKVIEPCFVAFTVVQDTICKEMSQIIGLKDTEEKTLSANVNVLREQYTRDFSRTKKNILSSVACSEKENVATPSRAVNLSSIKKLRKKFVPKMGKYKSISFRGLNRSVSITNIMTDLDKSEGLNSAPAKRMDSWEEEEPRERYSEPKEEQSQLLNRLKKEDSQESLRHSDFGSTSRVAAEAKGTDLSELNKSKIKNKRHIIDIADSDDDDEEKRDSLGTFSVDDEIESYFRN